MLKYFVAGFLTKIITGFDDMLTHIPLITYLTRTRMGKVAFSIGIFMAIILAILIAILFSSLIKSIPYYRYILGGIIFILAILIHFNILGKRRVKKTEGKIKKIKKMKRISNKRFLKLNFMGFFAAFATVIDDIIVYSPLFLVEGIKKLIVIFGILLATLIEILIIIYFSKKISKFKYKKEVASLGLFILGILVINGVI